MSEKLQIPSTIVCPVDEELLQKLRRKQDEYLERMGKYAHPELQLLQVPREFFKYRILKTVLDEGQAELGEIIDQISKDLPEAYEVNKCYLSESWAVIWDYCANAGKHAVNSKTGQPSLV